jgi:hypothetical protein
VLERYTPGLRAVNPAFAHSWIKRLWLHREPAAQPIVTVGIAPRSRRSRRRSAASSWPNTTQIFPEDRGTNYAVRLGDDAARALLEWS